MSEDDEAIESPRWLTDPSMTPEQRLEADELEHAIQHCLDALPVEFRTVVVLADIQGLDYTEVVRRRPGPPWAPSRAGWRAPGCACESVCRASGNFCPPLSVWRTRQPRILTGQTGI